VGDVSIVFEDNKSIVFEDNKSSYNPILCNRLDDFRRKVKKICGTSGAALEAVCMATGGSCSIH